MMEIISLILNLLLGGGLFVTLATIKSTRAQASHVARGEELKNEEKAADIVMDYLVEPLKKEINGLRKDVRKLSKAVEGAKRCRYSADCAVLRELHEHEAEPEGEQAGTSQQWSNQQPEGLEQRFGRGSGIGSRSTPQ